MRHALHGREGVTGEEAPQPDARSGPATPGVGRSGEAVAQPHDSRRRASAFALVLGVATVPGFAPFGLLVLPLATLAALSWLWHRADSPRSAARLGFAFGLGLFGAGVSWVYVSLHDFGGMPAAITVLVTAAFCAYLALFPAAVGWLAARYGRAFPGGFVLVAAAAWTIAEWLRGWLFTGFPWLAIGYSQVPASPLAGWAPMLGVFGVSFLLALSGAALANAWAARAQRGRLVSLLALAAAPWLAGAALQAIEWTQAQGEPVSVSLAQGNVSQDLKFREEQLTHVLDTYLVLAHASSARLTVLPESAVPLLKPHVPPDYLALLAGKARANGGDVLIGMFDFDPDTGAVYNAMFSLGAAPTQVYRKHHLVPFGEFIPFKWAIGWVYDTILHMPLADQASGPRVQEPMAVAGQRVAMNICYEDAFGEEIIRQLPAATLLVNVSNDAWFGAYVAPWQHTQIAQMRALETGRWMLRATNTGITSIIDQRGRVVAHLPGQQAGKLDGTAQGRAGATPYVRWGNGPVVGTALAILLLARWRARSAGSERTLPKAATK